MTMRCLFADPSDRVSARDALMMEFFLPYHDPAREPEARRRFAADYEHDQRLEQWKDLLYAELLDIASHPVV